MIRTVPCPVLPVAVALAAVMGPSHGVAMPAPVPVAAPPAASAIPAPLVGAVPEPARTEQQGGSQPAGAVVPDTTVEAAASLVNRGLFDEAARLLEVIVRRQPATARAWFLLGYALHRSGELDRALDAHLTAAQFPETAGRGLYNAAMVHALQGDVDRAFRLLFRARDEGGMDVTQVAADPDAAALRPDPRWERLFPTAAELADPFVEPVRVIHQWRGEAPGDQFGWIARAAGDVDADGARDVVASAPTHGDGAGKIYVYSSRTGALLWSGTGQPGERLGTGVEAAGDVDGDGIPDVAAGAPGADRAYVLSGSDGRLVRTFEGSAGEMFGQRAVGVGDVDGDGHDDLLVGAPGSDTAAEDAGAAYLYSGADGRRLLTIRGEAAGDALGSSLSGATTEGRTRLLIGAPGAGPSDRGRVYVHDGGGDRVFQIDADATGSDLGGMFVSMVGDVDGDGVADVYGSDWSDAAAGPTTGRAYVHSGATGARLHTFTGEAAGDGFGIGTAEAGDVDRDGHDDLVIGAWRHAGAAPGGGKVYLYSGANGRLLRAATGKVMGETLGFDATGLGDVDGDAIPDLLVTSAWSTVNGARSGRVWVLSGLWAER